jgi:hypothetical protein
VVGVMNIRVLLNACGSPRVRFPIVSLELLIDVNLPVALWFLTKMNTRNISWKAMAAGSMKDNLTTLMCRLSCNLILSLSAFTFTFT